jgi:hypothetical protein
MRDSKSMDVLIHTFTRAVRDRDGHTYVARVLGRERAGGMWEGWLEFRPKSTGILVRRSPIETTQTDRKALRYWASGLEPVYLEGALERAMTASRSATRASLKKTTES